MLKKIMAIILVSLMLFSATACMNTTDGNDKEESIFEYITFRWGNSEYSKYYPTAVGTSTIIGDALLARYAQLEEQGLTFIIEDMQNESDVLLQRLAIMQNVPDLFWGTSRKIGWQLYKEDSVYALDEIETIDSTSEKWGAKNFIQCAKYNGKEYGFYPWEWAYVPTYSGVLLFNVNILNEANVALPYEYQESKSWNRINFEDVLKKIKTNTDTDIAPWTTGSLNNDVWFVMMSDGLEAVIEDPVNGGYTWGYDCPEAIDSINWMHDLYVQGLYKNNGSEAFRDEQAAFFTGDLVEATNSSIASSVDTYGIITFPYGPNADYTEVSSNVFWSTKLNFIIKGSDNEPEMIGLIMEELFSPLDNVQNWKDYLYEEIVHDDRDYDNIMYMFENCKYDYSVQMYDTSGDLDIYFKQAVIGEMSPAAVFETTRVRANEEIKTNVSTID